MLVTVKGVTLKKVDGFGHTRSLVSSGQNSLILLNKYRCRSKERPGGLMIDGKSSFDGLQVLSESNLISWLSSSIETLTKTDPGWPTENLKW